MFPTPTSSSVPKRCCTAPRCAGAGPRSSRILDLDQELLAPRYRAASQAHWLLTRGAQLLAGRPRAETRLLLQTRIPDHVVVQAMLRGEPAAVAESEIDYRRTLAYPPFGALAELSGADDALAATVDALRAGALLQTPVQVFGPTDGHALVNAADWDALGRRARARAFRWAAPLAACEPSSIRPRV